MKYYVEVVKPSHYDDDGYVIQWRRAFIPSNSLACVFSLVQDVQHRRVLGTDVDIVATAYDEIHTIIPIKQIIKRIRDNDNRGVVLLVGVQTNQFPRAADLAKPFRDAGIPVVIGGFHVSGCLAMLPELPPEIRAVQEMGVSLFAGEAEGRMEEVLRDAWRHDLKPIYNYLDDLPDLAGQVKPFLPREVVHRTLNVTSFDTSRGCPFRCSFCTIINVQGRQSRFRTADDVEAIVRKYLQHGVNRYFITDDNMARNRNWEAIFDRLAEMRKAGLFFRFTIQVDTMCHKIPGFIDKAVRAGCCRVFIGMENINPDNLKAAQKFQNRISEYRTMLLQWRAHNVVTIGGYILGFPADTPESILRDLETIKRELPIDILEFSYLTPLPGSADHKTLYDKGVWMDPDMNKYDLEHAVMEHPNMSRQQWDDIYERAWHIYFDDAHIERMMRRTAVEGRSLGTLTNTIVKNYGPYCMEKLTPLQAGIFRRKIRTLRRPTLPREHPLVFYPQRVWEVLSVLARWVWFYLKLRRIRHRVLTDPNIDQYTDAALVELAVEDEERRELVSLDVVQRAA